MKLKQFMAGMLSLSLLIGCTPVFAADDDIPLLNVRFDDMVTNKRPDNVTITAGEVRVIEDGDKNKALFMDEEYTKLYMSSGTLPYNAVMTFDVKRMSDTTDFNVAFSSSATATGTKFIEVKDNEIRTTDGMYLGAVLDYDYTRVSVAIDNKNKKIDIYVNGELKAKRWTLSARLDGGVLLEKTVGSIVVDNVVVYEGKDINKKIDGKTYNDAADAYIDYNYFTNTDVSFVDSENLWDSRQRSVGEYENGSRAQKTNKITVNRLDLRDDPNRENGYIIIEKTTTDDAHYDIYGLNETKYGYFPYYYYEGRVKVEKLGAPVRFAYFRDTVSTGSNVDIEPARIDATGQVISGSGLVLKKVSKDEWLNFKIVLDLQSNKADIYIDDVLMDTYTYNAKFKQPCMFRIWVDTGNDCTAVFDKLKVLGMRHAYDPENPDYHPSVWGTDEGIEDFLADKTVFYGYSENVFADGEKHLKVDKPIMRDGVLYASAKALSLGYGLNLSSDGTSAKSEKAVLTAGSSKVTYEGKEYEMTRECISENNTVYIPVENFAAEVLGHDVKNDGNGLIVTSATPFILDTEEKIAEYKIDAITRFDYDYYNNVTPVKVLNWYMSYERPSADTIKEDFDETTNNGEMHPRIVGTGEEFDRIRENMNTDAFVKENVDKLLETADGYLDRVPWTYSIPDKQRILSISREYLARFRYLGFAYQITGDTKYADKVWEYIQAVLDFPDWNPSHLIDTAEMCTAVAIGYDWTYDYWTDEQRYEIYEGVKKLGLKPIKDSMFDLTNTRKEAASANDFATGKTNFNTVINSGAIATSLVFAELDEEFCFDLIHYSLRSLETSMLLFRPEGVWCESPTYWIYVASYLSKGIGTLINSTGEHYGFLDAQGLDKTAMWIRSMDSYGGINNFHDSDSYYLRTPFIGWYASVYGNGSLAATPVNEINNGDREAEPEDLIWYDIDKIGSEDDLPLDYFGAAMDTVSSRGSYTDRDGLYYSAHGGMVRSYHSQADVASFVFDLSGERWASDLGSENYNVQGTTGGDLYGYYVAYRRRPEAHNVMVFDPDEYSGMNDDGFAVVDKWETNDRGSIAIYDLTEVYSDDVTSARRGFYVGDDRRSLTIRDEFTPNRDMEAKWFMTTGSDVEIIDNNTAVLTKNGKKLKLELITNDESHTLTVGRAVPLDSSPTLDGQYTNSEYQRIALNLNLKSDQAYYVTVKLSAYNEAVSDINELNIPVSEWKLADGEYVVRPELKTTVYADGVNVEDLYVNGKIELSNGEPLPEITAVTENPENVVEITTDYESEVTLVRVSTPDGKYSKEIYVGFKRKYVMDDLKTIEIKNIEVSSTPEAWNHKMNMIDGDFSTRWTSAQANGESAIFDLGAEYSVNAIAAAFWQGYSRVYKFEIYASTDKKEWTYLTAGAGSGTTEDLELTQFDETTARYIKFVGSGSTANKHNNILEFRVLQLK